MLSYPAEPDGAGTPNTDSKSPTKKEEKKKESKVLCKGLKGLVCFQPKKDTVFIIKSII